MHEAVFIKLRHFSNKNFLKGFHLILIQEITLRLMQKEK
jgi:hypothetical protein